MLPQLTKIRDFFKIFILIFIKLKNFKNVKTAVNQVNKKKILFTWLTRRFLNTIPFPVDKPEIIDLNQTIYKNIDLAIVKLLKINVWFLIFILK